MKISYIKNININGLRFPKILTNYNNKNYIFGSLNYNNDKFKIKYLINMYEFDDEFNIVENSVNIINLKFIDKNYFSDINISSWIRDVGFIDEKIYLLIELKYNENENLSSKFYKLTTLNFINFEIYTKYNLGETDLLWLDYNNNIFKSSITKTDIFKWGQYEFNFIINNKNINPIFDKFIENNKLQGQIIHNIYSLYEEDFDRVIYSIRHKTLKYFEYKIYTAITADYKYFLHSEEINIEHKPEIIDWLCYPFRFKFNEEYYLICNNNDFGKNTYPSLFKIIED